MINTNDGSIQLESPRYCITPRLTKEDFLQSFLGIMSKPYVINPPWCSYWVRPIMMLGDEFAGTLFFEGSRLTDFYFASTRPEFGESSLEKELARKRYHEIWLNRLFGTGRIHVANPESWDTGEERVDHIFPWGSVISVYDERSCASRVIVRYNVSPIVWLGGVFRRILWDIRSRRRRAK